MYLQTLTIAAAISIAGLTVKFSGGDPSTTPDPMTTATPVPSTETLEHGKAMFNISCAPCHGADGTGNGPISANLRSKPRDLTKGIYLNRSTASGELPTDYDLFRTITTGLHNTAMPSFRQMRQQDRWAIVQYIKTLSPRFADSTEYPLDVLNVGTQVLPSPQSLERGRTLFLQMQCANCHGSGGEGNGPSASSLVDDFKNPIRPTDLTNPSDYKFSHSVLDVFRIFSTGLNGTPMPSYAASLSETDRWHLANYVWSLQSTDQYVDGRNTDSPAPKQTGSESSDSQQ